MVADQLRERHLWPLPWGGCVWCAVAEIGGSSALSRLIGNLAFMPQKDF